jgi:hypothetical protein
MEELSKFGYLIETEMGIPNVFVHPLGFFDKLFSYNKYPGI